MPFRLGPLTLASAWAPLLHPRIRALSFGPVPEIDCADCRLVRIGFFSARSKCCTYIPEFPNFLVGELLSSPTPPRGAAQVAAWVDAGRGDPLYLYAPPRLRQLHLTSAQRQSTDALPCPLLDEAGGCSVYAFRPYLCAGFHCVYPDVPHYAAFWNALSSLLALHSAIAAQYLMQALGLDRERFMASWDRVRDEALVWQDDHLLPEFQAELWQGQPSRRVFYQRCYAHLIERGDAIRGDLDAFRRTQLLEHLRTRGDLSSARARVIEQQSSDPTPQPPDAKLHQAFSQTIVVFGDHVWTVPEHEGFVLWYYERLVEQGVFLR